jgi:hypothetical protein
MKTILWLIFAPSAAPHDPGRWGVRPYDITKGNGSGDWCGPRIEASSLESARRLLPVRAERVVVGDEIPRVAEAWC